MAVIRYSETDVHRHTLTLGATGMLADVVRELARQRSEVSLLARHPQRISGKHLHPFPCDWGDEAGLLTAVRNAISKLGLPQRALNWCHKTGPVMTLAETLAHSGSEIEFYHVLGSAMSDPSRPDRIETLRRKFERLPGLHWHAICLGFVREGTQSRWLTNQEILQGILEALKADNSPHIVGKVRPWSARP